MAEKQHNNYLEEYQQNSEYSSQDGAATSEFTPAEQRKIIHKIDRRLVVLVGFMYCVSLMDRSNLGNAKVAGMGAPAKTQYQGLDLIKFRYNIMSLVFFPPYIVFQIPSTVIVRSLGPRLHLSTITFLWGCVMVGMAFVKDWQVQSGMRVLLGVLEAGFFPSCVYLLSTWYSRYDMGRRYSVFYILGCVASAFAGILAYGLMELHGKANLSAWRWIFLVEGLITVFVAIIGYILLIGFPDHWTPKWKFLSEREVKWVIDRVNADRGDATPEAFSTKKYLASALDWKIWAFAMIFFNTTTISYAMAYFLPDILHESLGFSAKLTQILTAPPYMFGGVIMYATGWIGDKYRIRGPLIVFNMVLTIIGLAILGYVKNGRAQYFSIFLVVSGVNANVPTVMTYQANNIRGQWKRAFCSATLVGFGGIGGIAGSLIFRAQDKKGGYKPGIWACLTCSCFNILLVGLLTIKFRRDNAKARAGKLKIEGSEEGFLYTY